MIVSAHMVQGVLLSMRGPWVVSVGLGWALRRSWVGGRHSFTKVYIDKLPIHRHRAAATRSNNPKQFCHSFDLLDF